MSFRLIKSEDFKPFERYHDLSIWGSWKNPDKVLAFYDHDSCVAYFGITNMGKSMHIDPIFIQPNKRGTGIFQIAIRILNDYGISNHFDEFTFCVMKKLPHVAIYANRLGCSLLGEDPLCWYAIGKLPLRRFHEAKIEEKRA